jgi:hypothetical protein
MGVLSATPITGINSILQVLAQTQQTLALEGFVPLTFLAFGILVPIVETWLLVSLFELSTDRLKETTKLTLKVFATILFLSALFVFFHLTAKGIASDIPLFMVFLFGIITFGLVMIERQGLAAILFHIIANTVALAIKFGMIPSLITVLVVVGVISLGSTLLSKGVKVIKGG